MMTMNPEVDDSIAITSKGLLYLHIQKLIPELDEKLFQEILDFGIETPDQFDDSYQGCWESYRPGADFAQQLMEDCGYMNPEITHSGRSLIGMKFGSITYVMTTPFWKALMFSVMTSKQT
jgi:hypothetical protein